MKFPSRRSLVAAALAATGASAAKADDAPAKLRVVYHLADLEKVNFVLSNMQNHLKGGGGPEKVTLALVVHGPALAAFRRMDGNVAVSGPVAALLAAGVGFHACGNTLKGMKISVGDLLEGFAEVPEGGVVRLAALQGQGWAYLRP
ncbi:MAG: DsrE family protein [Alphaproteobacteria bacterium]|nr:DsrE family protein [Alphaproteobacteria bacterium]